MRGKMNVKKLSVLAIWLILLVGCKEEISSERIGLQNVGIVEEDHTTYLWMTIRPTHSIRLEKAELDSVPQDLQTKVIEYEPKYTVDSFEKSKVYELPVDVEKDERVRILFKFTDTDFDLATVEKVYLKVNGQEVEVETDITAEDSVE